MAFDQGIAAPHWYFFAGNVWATNLETITPTGRVWNPETWLWDTPGSPVRHHPVDVLGRTDGR